MNILGTAINLDYTSIMLLAMINSFPNVYISSKNNVYNLTTTCVLVSLVICGFSVKPNCWEWEIKMQ